MSCARLIWPEVAEPSRVANQPIGPGSPSSGVYVWPVNATWTLKLLPERIARAGVITSSRSSCRKEALRPSTKTPWTSSPA